MGSTPTPELTAIGSQKWSNYDGESLLVLDLIDLTQINYSLQRLQAQVQIALMNR